MKKTIAMLLALVMVLALTACGSTEAEEKNPADASNEQKENVSQDAADDNADSEESLLIDLKAILGEAVSVDDYELSYMDEEFANLQLLDDDYKELDYLIKLGDGTAIELPMVYGELLDAGWVSATSWTETVEGNSAGFASHSNAAGDTIFVTIKNPTNQFMDLEDTWITGVHVGDDFTADFDIGGVSQGDTVETLIAAFGLPSSIEYFVDEDYASVDFIYLAVDGSVEFAIDVETGTVLGANYSHSDSDLA